ncbi:MAG: hypothetical protein ACI9GW_000918 [Halieaceae bacterium]
MALVMAGGHINDVFVHYPTLAQKFNTQFDVSLNKLKFFLDQSLIIIEQRFLDFKYTDIEQQTSNLKLSHQRFTNT